jgi:type I restriction enzyme S subunit
LRTPVALAVCIGATLGKIGWADRPLATNQQINAVIVGENLPRFVAAMMASPVFQTQMRESSSATTMPILNKGQFRKLRLPVPTPAKQQALLEQLDVMLDSTARLVATTVAAEARALALRRALFSAAFSGRLT